MMKSQLVQLNVIPGSVLLCSLNLCIIRDLVLPQLQNLSILHMDIQRLRAGIQKTLLYKGCVQTIIRFYIVVHFFLQHFKIKSSSVDLVQLPRISKCAPNPFLCIPRNSSRVLQDRPLEKSRPVFSDVDFYDTFK